MTRHGADRFPGGDGRRRVPRAVSLAVLLTGLAVGVGLFTFVYAEGASYLTSDARACANCHVMNDQFAGWTKGSHRAVAACNDCHTPPGFLGKYSTKALNGFLHSWAFTSGRFHEPIRIKERNLRVTESACRHCHQGVIEQIAGPAGGAVPAAFRPGPRDGVALERSGHLLPGAEGISCVRCHAEVGHR